MPNVWRGFLRILARNMAKRVWDNDNQTMLSSTCPLFEAPEAAYLGCCAVDSDAPPWLASKMQKGHCNFGIIFCSLACLLGWTSKMQNFLCVLWSFWILETSHLCLIQRVDYRNFWVCPRCLFITIECIICIGGTKVFTSLCALSLCYETHGLTRTFGAGQGRAGWVLNTYIWVELGWFN